MSVVFTEEQQRAIASRGKVIVSASAGSGKTAVMIERLVTLIVEEGVKLDEVVAVTFTNKAAAQMKEKLRKAILAKLADPALDERKKQHLKDQLYALPLADISTFHAFCARLVRTYFYALGERDGAEEGGEENAGKGESEAVDPAFRIVSPDSAEGEEIAARALDEMFENAYKENGEAFRALLKAYFRKKKDDKLRAIVKDLHRYARGKTDYREKLERMGGDNFEETVEFLRKSYAARAEEYAAIAGELSGILSGMPKAKKLLDQITAALKSLAGNDLFAMSRIPLEKLPNTPSASGAGAETSAALLRLKRLSKGVKELYKELGGISSCEAERARYLDGQTRAAALAALVLAYDKIYCRMMREAGALDYNDLEQCALEILGKEQVQSALHEKYKYLFVDEYQDVNEVQEKLIAALSKIGIRDIFLVGDRKQAIYGFRGSKSEYFLQREHNPEYTSLVLTANFRSGDAVLREVNEVFSRVMTEQTCGIAYSRAPMRGSERYRGHSGKVIYHRVTASKEEEEETRETRGVYSVAEALPKKSKTDAQAECIAQAVLQEYGSTYYNVDQGAEEPVCYRDIAILVRKDTKDAERIVAALAAHGIPVSTASKVNLYDFFEAKLIIDWLSYLDNGEQDIPLAAAMLSSIGAFTMEELTKIRLRFPADYAFRAAVKRYADEKDALGEKVKAFLALSEKLRLQAKTDTARSVVSTLLAMGLEEEIIACGKGKERLYRIQRLLFDAEGSVNEFLARLKRTGYRTEYAAGGGGDAVKVMTMHKSKGLEFPVVLLASLDKGFGGRDNDEVSVSDGFSATQNTLLFAPKSYDAEERLVYDTLLRRAIRLNDGQETVKEEFNVLYVAMTRAKYRLHLFYQKEGEALSPTGATRFIDLFPPELLQAEEEGASGTRRDETKRKMRAARADVVLNAPFEYAFRGGEKLPVKSSATALIQAEESASERSFPEKESAEKTSAEKGTAYHKFLEHVAFGKSAEEEILRLKKEGVLSEEEIALLDGERLTKILAIPALQALEGKRIWREQPFLLALPASKFENTTIEDTILYQGVIDLFGVDEEGYFLYDYKFSARGDEDLKRHYAKQMELYKEALAKILKIETNRIRAAFINLLSCEAISVEKTDRIDGN